MFILYFSNKVILYIPISHCEPYHSFICCLLLCCRTSSPLPTETISIYRLETTFQIADCYIKCMKNSVKTLTPASGLPESHTCPSVGSETLTPAHKWSPRPPSCPPGVSQTSTPAAQVSQTPTPARQWSPKRPPCPSGVSLTLIPARQVSP